MKSISKNPDSMKRAAQAGADATRQAISAARRAAFVSEADPMVGQVLRGEVSLDEYTAKVAEIRARFPYEKEA
jgi:hypothetical protein